MDDTIEEVNVLARSSIRAELLKVLFEHEQIKKDVLKERVAASRTGIQRNLDVLEERGWIGSNNKEYWITLAGKPVVEEFLELLNTIHVAKRLQPLLEWVPPNEFDLELHSLATADLIVSQEIDPYAPANRHINLMKSSDRFRCLLPAVGLQPMMVARDRVVNHGSTHTVVLDPDLLDTLQDNHNYMELVEDILSDRDSEMFVSERQIPFYLGIADDAVQIGVGDDQGTPRSLVESKADDVQGWAERKYDKFKANAKPLASLWDALSVPKTQD